MHTWTHTHTHTHAHTHNTHTYIHIYIHTYIQTYTHTYNKLINPIIEKVFNDVELKNLQEMYNCLYPAIEYDTVEPSRFYLESKQISVNHHLFLSSKSRF